MSVPSRDFHTDSGLSDQELNRLAQHLGAELRAEFKGVYSKDQIPTLHDQECMIVNIQNNRDPHGRALPGTHWVSAGIQHGHAWYFDSFGLAPPVNIAAHLPRPIAHSQIEIQDPASNLCGLFALGACDAVTMHPSREPSASIHEFVELFDAPTLEKNDEKLQTYFAKRTVNHHLGLKHPKEYNNL